MSTTPAIPPADIRSYNQKLLDQIRALIIGKALDDVSSYKIGTRELVKIPLMELRAWEAEIEGRVRRELRRKQGLPRQNVGIIFGSGDEIERPRLAGWQLFAGRHLEAIRWLIACAGCFVSAWLLPMKDIRDLSDVATPLQIRIGCAVVTFILGVVGSICFLSIFDFVARMLEKEDR